MSAWQRLGAPVLTTPTNPDRNRNRNRNPNPNPIPNQVRAETLQRLLERLKDRLPEWIRPLEAAGDPHARHTSPWDLIVTGAHLVRRVGYG